MHIVHVVPDAPRLSAVDLNLVPVLDALLHERHVTRAARRVGLSQSATSHALARLRALFGDPLLTRTRRGMVLTPRGEALREPVRRAVEALSLAVRPEAPFDPKTARRTLRVATTDYAEIVLMPGLVDALTRGAPGIDLHATVFERGVDGVVRGDLDLALAPSRAADRGLPGVRSEELFEERFVCVLRRGHPLLRGRRPLTLDAFCAARHAFIAPRGRPGGVVDDALAAMGRSRRIAFATPHFSSAPFVVARSDLVLTVAERIARALSGVLPLEVREPPLPLAGFTMAAYWHERAERDPAHAWVRARLVEVARAAGRSP